MDRRIGKRRKVYFPEVWYEAGHIRVLNSTEMKRSGIEVEVRHAREDNSIESSGGDAFRGHTRSHPEHDG